MKPGGVLQCADNAPLGGGQGRRPALRLFEPVAALRTLARISRRGPISLRKRADATTRSGYPRVAARHKRACSSKENPFVNHKAVADDIGQGLRSAASWYWSGHRTQIRPISPLGPPHLLRLTTLGREMARLLWGGHFGSSRKRGFILPILRAGRI